MTAELKKEAEEYAEVSTNEYKDGLVDIDDISVLKEAITDGFLAGLKAGRPQWHDLRENPNDLPKEGMEVLNDDGVEVVRINGHWRYVYGDEWEDDAHLDYWCEIPTFDKE